MPNTPIPYTPMIFTLNPCEDSVSLFLCPGSCGARLHARLPCPPPPPYIVGCACPRPPCRRNSPTNQFIITRKGGQPMAAFSNAKKWRAKAKLEERVKAGQTIKVPVSPPKQ